MDFLFIDSRHGQIGEGGSTDADGLYIETYNSNQKGKGSVKVVVDENGNGVFDAGESFADYKIGGKIKAVEAIVTCTEVETDQFLFEFA